MKLLIIFLATLLCLIKVVYSDSVEFLSPSENQDIPANSVVDVEIDYQSKEEGSVLTVTQKCGNPQVVKYFPVGTNSQLFTLPAGYSGSCQYEADNNDDLQVIRNFYIYESIIITSPLTGTRIPANSDVDVNWIYQGTIDLDPTATVTLACAGQSPQTTTSDSLSVSFTVSPASYGTNCAFTVSVPENGASNPRFVVITQQLEFELPGMNSIVSLSNPSFMVKISSPLNDQISDSVDASFSCESGTSDTHPFPLNSAVPYTYPSGSYGLCSLSVPGPLPLYLESPVPIQFYMKFTVAQIIVSSILLPIGQDFQINVITDPVNTSPLTTTVSLYCDGNNDTPVQEWPSVPLNSEVTLNLNDMLSAGSNCYFQTPADSSYLTQAEGAIVDLIGFINITSPLANTPIPSGSYYQVEWSYAPVLSVPSFNISLICPSVGTSSDTVQADSINFSIPSNFYGDDCYFLVEAQNYLPSNVPVIISVEMEFNLPTEGEIIYLTSNYIQTELVTPLNTAFNESFTVNFACGSSFSEDLPITANQLSSISISNLLIGNCSLSILNQPSYLVPSNINVNFTLMYVLNFTIVPSTVYLGQSFHIQIDTLSTMSAMLLENLSLYCNGSNVPSQTWEGIVLINSLNGLPLNDDISLSNNCYFNTSSSSTYDAISYGPVSVSKVPVYFVSPSNGTIIQQQDQLLVVLNSDEVESPDGSVNVVLNCASGYYAYISYLFQIKKSLLNSPGTNFPYSPDLYGLCELYIDDPVFQGNGSIILDFVYVLSFTDAPQTIYVGQYFKLPISSSFPIPANLTSTNVYLYCNSHADPTYVWYDVPLNDNDNTLQVPFNLTENDSGCLLMTDGLPNFIAATLSGVSVQFINLSFEDPKQDEFTQPNSFNLLVDTETVQNPQGNVTVEMNCPGLLEPLLINATISVPQVVDIPLEAYGLCTLNITTPGFNAPHPLEFIVRFVLSFAQDPSPIYIGQPFSLEIASTGSPASDFAVNVTLACSEPEESYTWPFLPLNQAQNLTVPSGIDFYPSITCTLFTEVDPNYVQASIPVIAANVQLQFSEPQNMQKFNNTDEIPILVTADNFPNLVQEIPVTLQCGDNFFTTVYVNTSIQTNFPVPDEAFGNCLLNTVVPLNGGGFNPAHSIQISIYWPLSISDVSSQLYISQTFDVEVTPVLPTALDTDTLIILVCEGKYNQIWYSVPFGQLVPLTLNTTLTPSSDCHLETFTENIFVIDTSSNTFEIVPVVLSFEYPEVDSTTVIPSSFPLQVASQVNTSIDASIVVTLTCGVEVTTIDTFTNVLINVDPLKDFNGLCSLEVTEAPSYFVVPEVLQFYLKYSLSFVNPPTTLNQRTFFFIQIDSSANPPIGLDTTTLNLICNVDDSSVTIQSWPAVPLNQQNVLQLGSVPSSATNCVLTTTGDDTKFIQTSTPVTIITSISPFDGDLIYISPEQAEEFARQNFIITGIVQITFEN